jgi:hypothetical protein
MNLVMVRQTCQADKESHSLEKYKYAVAEQCQVI